MAVPRLDEMAQRLVMARHDARVEDSLDGVPPVLRLILRPWRGPLAAPGPVEGTLEIRAAGMEQDLVVIRSSCESADPPWADEERIPPARITATFLEGRIVSFVGQVLDRA